MFNLFIRVKRAGFRVNSRMTIEQRLVEAESEIQRITEQVRQLLELQAEREKVITEHATAIVTLTKSADRAETRRQLWGR
jgi:hypothetical protein